MVPEVSEAAAEISSHQSFFVGVRSLKIPDHPPEVLN
jgi:hypothetical protein